MGGIHNQPDLIEVGRIREQAAELLGRLLADRARLEIALAETGRRDAMKWVTGRSSLDNAIDATRTALRQVDQVLTTQRSGADRESTKRLKDFSRPSLAAAGATVGA